MVLGKIREGENTHTLRPTTPPSTSIPDTILDRTPHNSKEIIDQGKILQRRISAGKKVNPKYLSRFIKGSIASAHSRQIVEDELKSVLYNATQPQKLHVKSLLGRLHRKVGFFFFFFVFQVYRLYATLWVMTDLASFISTF